jgi:hypothetical protein
MEPYKAVLADCDGLHRRIRAFVQPVDSTDSRQLRVGLLVLEGLVRHVIPDNGWDIGTLDATDADPLNARGILATIRRVLTPRSQRQAAAKRNGVVRVTCLSYHRADKLTLSC